MCAKAKEDKEAKKAAAAAAKAEKAAAKEASKAAKAKPKAKAKKKQAGANDYNFFLLHGEKVGLVAGIAIFAGLVAGGSGLEKFTLTPDQINQSSTNADNTIKNSKVTPVEYDESVVVYPYDAYSELIKSSVKVNAYETPTRWEQSLFPDKVKRPSVKPLPLENLHAVACVGAIMYKPISANGAAAGGGAMGGAGMAGGAMGGAGAMGGMGGAGGMGNGGELKGRHWITLTGSIPIRKQQAVYNDLFANAQYMDDVRDQPLYIFYNLERGEVDQTGKTTWKPIKVIPAYQKEVQKWSGVGSDQVAYNYMAPVTDGFPPMAMNCPPMANKPFGEEVANLPNIPLNSTEQIDLQSEDLQEWNKLQDAMNKFDETDLLNRDPFAGAGMMGSGAGMMAGGMGGMSGGMGGMSGGMGGMSGGMSDGMNGGVGGNSWLVNQNAVSDSLLRVQQSVSVDYYLFRYFDFDVEPDKTYVYRVQLILGNPNYGVEEHFVADPEDAKNKQVYSDFSEQSNPVALGAVSRVFVESVEASARPGAEPKMVFSSVYFDDEDASESIVQHLSVKRGQVANFYGRAHEPIDVAGSASFGMMDGMDMVGGGGGSKKGGKNQRKTVNHISDVCVVDALGGEKITGAELRAPSKALILEPNGLLRVRELKEDARELGRYDGSAGGGMTGMGTGAAGMMM